MPKKSVGLFLSVGLAFVLIVKGVLFIHSAEAGTTGSLLPTGDGSYRDWFNWPSTTTYGNAFTTVHETPCDGSNSYIYTTNTSALFNRESFYVDLSSSTVPNGSLIRRITITPCASGHTGGRGSSILDVFYRYNQTNSGYLGNYLLTGTTPVQRPGSVFSGLSLLKTSTSTLQLGVRLTSGTVGARVSQLAATIDYSQPTITADLLPIADGFYQNWSMSSVSGTNHFPLVNEQSCDGEGAFVFATTTGIRDSYLVSLASIPSGSTITQISLYPCASTDQYADPSTSSSIRLFYRLNGGNSADGAAYYLSSSTTPVPLLPSTDFSGLNLTMTSSTSLEIGSVFGGGPGGARLSRIAARVTYIPLTW